MLSTLCAALLAAGAPAADGASLDPFLVQFAETRGFRAGRPAAVTLSSDGRTAFFLRSGPRSRTQTLFETDLASGETREVVPLDRIPGNGTASPTTAEAARLERQRIQARGITGYTLAHDGRHVAFTVGGRLHLLVRATGAVRVISGADGALDPRFSPDGRRLAYVLDGDLRVLDLATGRSRRLTRAAAPWRSAGLAEFVAQEEMGRSEGYWWSPDSRSIAYATVDERPVEKHSLCDPGRPRQACQETAYPRAGTPNAVVGLKVIPVAGGPAVAIRWHAARYPYLASVTWEAGAPLALLVQDRHQQEEVLLAADARSGTTRPLLVERDAAWVGLWDGMPAFRPDGRFYWITERNGGPELELRGKDGALERSVVPPSLGLTRFVGYDAGQDAVVVSASADPTQDTIWRIRGGGAPEPLALDGEGPATRRVQASESGGALAVSWSTLRRMSRTAVFGPTGARLAELPSVAEEPPEVPTTELRRVGQGEGLWTAVLRPHALGTAAALPVLLDVYAGPSGPRARHEPMIIDQWLADQGFAVVVVDGRGTSGRGRAFDRAIRGDFSAIPLDDQVAGLTALGAELPWLDLTRVGATGWSFGGYASALAVLRRPDLFKAAVAGAPVTEWRDYDTHYTERYLGLPDEDPAAYDRSSLLPRAAGLSRPLLLVHGTADDNVHLSHTMQLAEAFFRAGRPFQLLLIPGATHAVPDPVARSRELEAAVRFLSGPLGAVRPGPAPGAPPARSDLQAGATRP